MERVALDCCVKRPEAYLFPEVVYGDQGRNFDTSVFANTQYVSTQACKKTSTTLLQLQSHGLVLFGQFRVFARLVLCMCGKCKLCFLYLAGMQPTVTHSNMRQEIDEQTLCLNGITI